MSYVVSFSPPNFHEYLNPIHTYNTKEYDFAFTNFQKDYEKAVQDEANRKKNEVDEALANTNILINEDPSQSKRMRNRFSKRNSTIRGSDIDHFLSELTNTKLLVLGVLFVILNIMFTRYFG